MIRTAIIDTASNAIVNVVEYDEMPGNPPPGFNEGIIAVAHERVGTNWTYQNGVLVEPEPIVLPAPVPQSISDRQFFQQLAIEGTITKSQALAAVKTGVVPPALEGFIDAITDVDQKFAANMLLSGATTFERSHPLTEAIGAAQGKTPAQIDAFWQAAAAL